MYHISESVVPAAVAQLCADAGLNRLVDDRPRLIKILTQTNLIVTARDGAELIGTSGSLTDSSYCCSLADLAVAGAQQWNGIGREPIRRTQVYLGDEVMILLLAAASAKDYYGHIDFTKNNDCWFLRRKR